MENSSEWHTQVVGVSIDRNGMFEREKRIKGGSKMNINKEGLKIKYRGFKGIFKGFVFG